MSRSYDEAQIKARLTPGYDPNWASATEHKRDTWPAPDKRRKCHCGCGRRATHIGGTNGLALTGGCELSMRRWVRDGFTYKPMVEPKSVTCPTCGVAVGKQCRAASGQRAKHCHASRWEAAK